MTQGQAKQLTAEEVAGLKKEKTPRAPNREPKIIIKEQIDKLSNADLKEIAEYCLSVKNTRKAKAEAEFKELE
jgi:cytochrome c553